jgi:hypothetical protein
VKGFWIEHSLQVGGPTGDAMPLRLRLGYLTPSFLEPLKPIAPVGAMAVAPAATVAPLTAEGQLDGLLLSDVQLHPDGCVRSCWRRA